MIGMQGRWSYILETGRERHFKIGEYAMIYRGHMIKLISPGMWEIKNAKNEVVANVQGDNEEAAMAWVDKRKKEEFSKK